MFQRLHFYMLVLNMTTTGIGRKNKTDYTICRTLTSNVGHPEPSFHCVRDVRKLFTIVTACLLETRVKMSLNIFKRVLQM